MNNFLLAVLSLPGVFPGEADCMEALLSAGLGRLHLRKPEAGVEELEALVRRLAPRWAERLVLHGPNSRELALRYGVPNVHGAVEIGRAEVGRAEVGRAPKREGRERSDGEGHGYSGGGPVVDAAGLALSTSVHGWEEFSRLPEGLTYAFISPL
ncbi:MAG TPA: hypothetical protein VGS79_26480, partial [Puia sp.]|nr:hypothetical protein [Puia sp.]